MSIKSTRRGVNFCLVYHGRVLLQQRDEHCPYGESGKWCFPGGGSEPEDTDLIDTVVREVKEEYDLIITREHCQFLCARPDINPGAVFVCILESIEGLELHEGKAMEWVSFDDLAEREFGFGHEEFIVPELQRWQRQQESTLEYRPFSLR